MFDSSITGAPPLSDGAAAGVEPKLRVRVVLSLEGVEVATFLGDADIKN